MTAVQTAPSPYVVAESLAIRFGATDVLQGVDLEVLPGAQIAISGRSGSGKSTLLLALAGLITPTRGMVSWPGLASESPLRRGQIGMVFQAPSLMPELTALENVTLPLRLRDVDVGAARARALAALVEVGVADVADALPAQLSGGQQQRVAVARALAGRHRLVLADEPTGALDREHAHHVVQALRDAVAAVGGALVLATHDPELAALLDQKISVDDGHLALAGLR
ncbi:MAG: ABC transporter ATP-binding protein [Sporichthyaceae bacterium]